MLVGCVKLVVQACHDFDGNAMVFEKMCRKILKCIFSFLYPK